MNIKLHISGMCSDNTTSVTRISVSVKKGAIFENWISDLPNNLSSIFGNSNVLEIMDDKYKSLALLVCGLYFPLRVRGTKTFGELSQEGIKLLNIDYSYSENPLGFLKIRYDAIKSAEKASELLASDK